MIQIVPNAYWFSVPDGDKRLSAIYQRHYSCYQYKDNRRKNPNNPNKDLVMGPGYKLCLLGYDIMAGFGWRIFKDDSGQQGVNCSFFRNEGATMNNRRLLSSEMILEAEQLCFNWCKSLARKHGEKFLPDENKLRVYTYVAPPKIESPNPGYCFKKAGWSFCGITKHNKLHILEKYL